MKKPPGDVVLDWQGKKRSARVQNTDARIVPWEIFPGLEGADGRLANHLFWGDNLEVMRWLSNSGHHGKIDLIYIDPPFYSGLNYKYKGGKGKRHRAYKDTWEGGLPQYLDYLQQRLLLAHELLSSTGSLYVHLDWHVAHYVKVLLDEIFGYDNFKNQIIWKRLTYKQTQVKSYGVLHDVILYYTKSENYTWNDVRAPYEEKRLRKYFRWVETPDGENIRLKRGHLDGKLPMPEGRRFALNPIINPNPDRPNLTYEFLGTTRVWKYKKEKMLDYHERGIVFQPSPGTIPQKKQYLDESPGMKLNDIFLDISGVMGNSKERAGYDTQKPEKLLERLISVSSNEGDVIADFYCGSGTSLVAATRLGRRWIGCDVSRQAVTICKKRVLPLGGNVTIKAWKAVPSDLLGRETIDASIKSSFFKTFPGIAREETDILVVPSTGRGLAAMPSRGKTIVLLQGDALPGHLVRPETDRPVLLRAPGELDFLASTIGKIMMSSSEIVPLASYGFPTVPIVDYTLRLDGNKAMIDVKDYWIPYFPKREEMEQGRGHVCFLGIDWNFNGEYIAFDEMIVRKGDEDIFPARFTSEIKSNDGSNPVIVIIDTRNVQTTIHCAESGTTQGTNLY